MSQVQVLSSRQTRLFLPFALDKNHLLHYIYTMNVDDKDFVNDNDEVQNINNDENQQSQTIEVAKNEVTEEVVPATKDDFNLNEKTQEMLSKAKDMIDKMLPLHDVLPNTLPIVSLLGRPIFPGVFAPMMLTSKEDIQAVEAATNEDGFIGFVLMKKEVDKPKMNDLYRVGTLAKVIKKLKLPDGGYNLFISTITRFKIVKRLGDTYPFLAQVRYLKDTEDNTFEVKALMRALVAEMKDISEDNPLFSEETRMNMVNIDNPSKIADFVASVLNIEKEEQQAVLETLNVKQRLEDVLIYVKKEQELVRIQRKIQKELNEQIEKNQREYFLKEEMKSIQEELGELGATRGNDYVKLKQKIEKLSLTGEAKEVAQDELEKLHTTDSHDPEYSLIRNYLDWIVTLPWNDNNTEDYNLEKAYKILQKEHYGMDDVKKRIMEYLCVRKLKKDNKGSILIFVGPPGVGKTSIGRSIAKAMNKPFYRFSVGGMKDEAEIKGHRRTYIGAMPGKILQGLKITKSRSPVFLIDEIDKMASSNYGDPTSALLEVLDPEQNVNFRDHYLDLPFDISDIFFILTANSLDTVPNPLLDRAEIITLSGYIDQEKIQIAKKFLIPKNLVKNGMKRSQVHYTMNALLTIAQEYAREAGVRNFEKALDKINRKIIRENLDSTYEIDEKKDESASNVEEAVLPNANIKSLEEFNKMSFTIDENDLQKYLGKPVFDESEIKKALVPGTAIGLAWTSMGGDTLLLESIAFPSGNKGGLQLTGQMGDVMKESATIALNWARQYAIKNKIKKAEWFEKNTVHLHIPEGATPKDGPSAGITMATTFMSLLRGKKIKPQLAMTGELSLTGQVLPIGGLREKTVAAKRNKIKTILIPKANLKDLDDIPDHVKKGLTFVPVSRAEEVMEKVF